MQLPLSKKSHYREKLSSGNLTGTAAFRGTWSSSGNRRKNNKNFETELKDTRNFKKHIFFYTERLNGEGDICIC